MFRSAAQKRKFLELLKDGKITQETYDKWNKEVTEKLPERSNLSSKVRLRMPRRVIK